MRMKGYFCALNVILVTTVYESNGSNEILSKTIHSTGQGQNGKIIVRDIARDFFVNCISEQRRPRRVPSPLAYTTYG